MNWRSAPRVLPLFFLFFLPLFLFSLLLPAVALAESGDEQAIKEVVAEYYGAFLFENMEGYLATQYLDHLSDAELQEKRDRVQQLFDSFAFGYATDVWHEISVEDDVAVARYILTANVFDGNSYDGEKFAYELDTTAILFKTPQGWKIYAVAPTTQVNFEAYLDSKRGVDVAAAAFAERDNTPAAGTTGNATAETNATMPDLPVGNATNVTSEAATCAPDLASFADPSFDLASVPGAASLLGDGVTISFTVDDAVFTYRVQGDAVTVADPVEDADYRIVAEPCAMDRILAGADPLAEYDAGNIKVEGGSFGASAKLLLGRIAVFFYGLFAAQPQRIWIEAETGELENPGRWSFIGATSRGPGELYLGTGGSQAVYAFESEKAGTMHLYIRVSDDGLHASGARSAVFVVNGVELPYNHVSKNSVVEGNYWGWERVGTVSLAKGANTLVVKKPQQTSAAFTMDKLVLSEDAFEPS